MANLTPMETRFILFLAPVERSGEWEKMPQFA